MNSIQDLDIIEFFSRTTGLEPTQAQKELLIALIDPAVSKIAISAGRQTGKTLCCAVACVWLSLHQKINIIVTSVQDVWLYAHVRDIFNANPDLRNFIISEGVFSIVPLRGYETKVGAKVHLRASTDKSLRGVPANVVFCDEAELMSDASIQTALGNLSGTFKFILLGTPPREKRGLFYQIIKDPIEHGFRFFKWSAENCSWHTKELLDSQKRELGQWYRSEVQGELLEDSERSLIACKHIDACTKNNVFREGGYGRLEAGIDWGNGDRCYTVLTIIERLKSRIKVLLVKIWETDNISKVFLEIAEILYQWKLAYVKVDAFPLGYSDDLRLHYKKKVYPIEFGGLSESGSHKNKMLGQLQRKIETHQLEIPESEVELIQQLKRYRRGMRYGDDYVDSLCLAIYEDSKLFKPEGNGCVTGPWNTPQRNIGSPHRIGEASTHTGYMYGHAVNIPHGKTRIEQIVDEYNKKVKKK